LDLSNFFIENNPTSNKLLLFYTFSTCGKIVEKSKSFICVEGFNTLCTLSSASFRAGVVDYSSYTSHLRLFAILAIFCPIEAFFAEFFAKLTSLGKNSFL
jgi:hypothetical protein